MKPKIAIIMEAGNKSDFYCISNTTNILDELKIPYSVKICSVELTSDELYGYIQKIDQCSECKVIIATASTSAISPGYIAGLTIKPVIGLPIPTLPIGATSNVNTMASILSTLLTPIGTPVLNVGVNAEKNAALAAAQILALSDNDIAENLKDYRADLTKAVYDNDAAFKEKMSDIVPRTKLQFKCEL